MIKSLLKVCACKLITTRKKNQEEECEEKKVWL